MGPKYWFLCCAMVFALFVSCAVFELSDDSDALDNGSASMTVQQGSSSTYTWAQACPSMAAKSTYDNRYFYQHDITIGVGTSSSVSDGATVSGITVSWNSSGLTLSATSSVTARTYYILFSDWTTEDDSYTVSFKVTAASSSTTNYTVTFSISSGSSYGSLSHSSISVPSGTTYSKSGNNLVFKSGSTTLYTVTPTPKSATSSYTYSFGSWSSTSGTISAAKDITCTFTRSAVVTYSNPVISVGSAGSTITLTSDVSVTWSISTNSSKASLSSTSGTSTTVTPSAYGYIVVKAVHNGNSSYYSTQTLNICSLVYNANGGSGAPSTQFYIQSGSSSHSFTPSGTATYSGKAFVGWNTSSSASSGLSSVSVSYRSTSTVYAIWTTPVSITVGSAGSTIKLTSNVSASWSK